MKKTYITCALLFAGLILTGAQLDDSEILRNDMEIAHIAYTAGEIDIRYAHLALAISETPEVRAFAETMIRDHTAVNKKALALLEKLGASPVDNQTSQKLLSDAAGIRSELRRLNGKAFDKRYVANELGYHAFVNETIEKHFIPNVQNEEFKGLLNAALQTFKIHEGHARKLNDSVSG